MTRVARENLAVILALLAVSWPAAWLLFGVGLTIGPLWRLVAFYWSASIGVLLGFSFSYAVIDTFLEYLLKKSLR